MHKYNPNIHHRRSIRLKGYDYSQTGLYFITICVQDRACLFGSIDVGADLRVCPLRDGPDDTKTPKMILNDAGCMIEKWYYELENKYPDKRCHEMVVMPNHIHSIIENMETRIWGAHVGAPLRGRPITPNDGIEQQTEKYGIQNVKYGATIGDAMDWFKTMTTNEYIRGVKNLGWSPFFGKLWQRNYYERIIRDEQSYERISE
jgi:REP element-mobilizing transposase RayT